jgi:CrcB protein
MQKFVLIGLGGLLGTFGRYYFSQWIDTRADSAFSPGTLAVNLTGCFAAGFLFHFSEQMGLHPDVRLAMMAGFLGAFTTFSAYGLQTLLLVRNGATSMALINVVISNLAGLLMVWIGAEIGRRAV